jgi:hypothetical protein
MNFIISVFRYIYLVPHVMSKCKALGEWSFLGFLEIRNRYHGGSSIYQ